VPELEGPERKLLEATRESLHAELSTWGRDRATYSLIHADLHPKNVLVDGERLHVIDFDDAGFGWHAYELAVALFSYQGQACFEAAREGLVAGYRAERPLDERTLERMPTFLLIRGLALIGWLHDRPELGLGPFVRVLIRSVCEQAETYCGKGGGARAARPD
jgi:Ser/Thr protein kinase RdoA (MazF antagonist)